MSDVTREQFASAVTAAVSSMHHLYREVHHLIAGLRAALAQPPSPLAAVRGTGGKGSRDQTRLDLRSEFGVLLGSSVLPDDEDVEDEDDEEVEEEEVEEEGAGQRGKRRTPPTELEADQPLLAVRIAMYDSNERQTLEPNIRYAVMSDWAVGGAALPAGHHFELRTSMVRRVPKALAVASFSKGTRLTTAANVKRMSGARKGGDRRLSCLLPMGVETVPLYSLDSPEELDRLAEAMKRMWNDVANPASSST
jgi:hypothetical protein